MQNNNFKDSKNNENIFNGKLIDVLNKEVHNNTCGEIK